MAMALEELHGSDLGKFCSFNYCRYSFLIISWRRDLFDIIFRYYEPSYYKPVTLLTDIMIVHYLISKRIDLILVLMMYLVMFDIF